MPDPDLLKTIHAYAADYYGALSRDTKSSADFRSLDETALLAMGILLEEAAAHHLGNSGDLALVEQAEVDHGLDGDGDVSDPSLPSKK